MFNGLKFWFLRKFKPNDEKVKEKFSVYIKKKCKKIMGLLRLSFQRRKYWYIRHHLLRLMRKVGSPFSFKKTSQFFDTFRFTDTELRTITGDIDGKVARERIGKFVNHLLITKKFRNTYWDGLISWILIFAPI